MTIGLWNLLLSMFYGVVVVAAVVVVVGSILQLLVAFVPQSKCTGDCDQGRHCTCDKGESNG
jgi:peptidoglycan biosynthesis protein MviN/MurJ (putative lipid II flippase)